MAAPFPSFYQGEGLQQSYYQSPAPLFPYNLPLPQPLFNSNPWAVQCMPPVQYYHQQQQPPPSMNTGYKYQPMRGRGKNWHRQVILIYCKL